MFGNLLTAVPQVHTPMNTSPSGLQILWFGLIAVLWIGFLCLEGFDFGVGMLLLPLARKNDSERRAIINTIGPHWDGNQVWLLTAGGATFAAFPEWYATLFSGAYLALFVILLALIIRDVAFEYRGKIDTDKWRHGWDWCITIGSWVPPLILGVAFGDLVGGLPVKAIASSQYLTGGIGVLKVGYDGNFFGLLANPFALLGGLALVSLCLIHGALFLSLKLDGDLKTRVQKVAPKLAILATVLAAVWAVWMQFAYNGKGWTWIPLLLAAVSLILVVAFTYLQRSGFAFTFSVASLAFAVALLFGCLYPNVIAARPFRTVAEMAQAGGIAGALPAGTTHVSLSGIAFNLTDKITGLPITMASSTHNTLVIMTWVACVLTPIVLCYQAWSIWVFRKRLSAERMPAPKGLPTKEPAELKG